MSHKLDGYEFSAYCHQLNLSKSTREVVAHIRNSPPARTPSGRRGNMPVFFPSPKMGCIIKAESHRVEFARLLELEHDTDVLEYYDQPPPIPLTYKDRHGRRQQPQHVADYFIMRIKTAGWEECKTEDELERLAIEKPHRYQRGNDSKWVCPPGEDFAAQYGLTYTVFSSADINWNAQSNWLYLEDYYQAIDKLDLPHHVIARIQRLVETFPGISLTAINEQIPEATYDVLQAALARNDLYTDFNRFRLEDKHRLSIPVYLNQEASLRCPVAIPQDEIVPLQPREYIPLLEHGMIIFWDGIPWQITNVGETEISLLEQSGQIIALSLVKFHELLTREVITGVRYRDQSQQQLTIEGRQQIERASPKELEKANFRYRVIHPELYQDEEQEKLRSTIESVPKRTKYLWKRQEKLAESLYGNGYVGLLGKIRKSGGSKLAPEVVALIHQVLTTYYDTTTQKLKRGAYAEYLLQAREIGQVPVSQKTFYAHAHTHKTTFDQALARGGKRLAYPFKEPYRNSQRTTNPHGLYAWDHGYIDHTPLDIVLRDSDTGDLMRSAWLSMLILGNPHRIAAFLVSFDPPSYRACLLLFRLCVHRFRCLPTSIIVDGGPDFHSTYFEQLLAMHEIRKQERPKSEPRFGSIQERLFETLNTEVLYHLAGNTQALKHIRQLSKASDPRRQAIWTLPALVKCLQTWAFDIYDNMPLESLRGQSPHQAYSSSLYWDGSRKHKSIAYDETFIMMTYPTSRTGEAIVRPGKGVRIQNIDYWCEAMRDPRIEDTKVPVRYDPFDINRGFAYIQGQWRHCQSAYSEFVGCSEREMEIISQEMRQMKTKLHGRAQIELSQAKLAQYRRENAGNETILHQQRSDNETRKGLAILLGEQNLAKTDRQVNDSDDEVKRQNSPENSNLVVFRRRASHD